MDKLLGRKQDYDNKDLLYNFAGSLATESSIHGSSESDFERSSLNSE